MQHAITLTICLLTSASACSTPPAALTAAPQLQISTAYLLQKNAQEAARFTGSELAAWRQQNFADFYRGVVALASDEPLRVADLGLSVAGVRSRLLAAQPLARDLAAAFPTMGDIEDAGILAPPQPLTAPTLRSALMSLLNNKTQPASLDLTSSLPNQTTLGVPHDAIVRQIKPNYIACRHKRYGTTVHTLLKLEGRDWNRLFQITTKENGDVQDIVTHGPDEQTRSIAWPGLTGGIQEEYTTPAVRNYFEPWQSQAELQTMEADLWLGMMPQPPSVSSLLSLAIPLDANCQDGGT